VKVPEPALDLPMAVAIASCYKNRPIDAETVIVGEVGLGGEVRAVNQIEARIAEAEKLGFGKIILPKGNLEQVKRAKIKVVPVFYVTEALKASVE